MKTRATWPSAFWEYPRHPIITHTVDSCWITSENKKKNQSYQFQNCQKFKFLYFPKKKIYSQLTFWSCMIRCIYEMDPVSIVDDAEWTQFRPQTEEWNDTTQPLTKGYHL